VSCYFTRDMGVWIYCSELHGGEQTKVVNICLSDAGKSDSQEHGRVETDEGSNRERKGSGSGRGE